MFSNYKNCFVVGMISIYFTRADILFIRNMSQHLLIKQWCSMLWYTSHFITLHFLPFIFEVKFSCILGIFLKCRKSKTILISKDITSQAVYNAVYRLQYDIDHVVHLWTMFCTKFLCVRSYQYSLWYLLSIYMISMHLPWLIIYHSSNNIYKTILQLVCVHVICPNSGVADGLSVKLHNKNVRLCLTIKI